MESYDEEWLVYEALEFGSLQGDYNVRELEMVLDWVVAGVMMFYIIFGLKMFWQFGELGYDFFINYCEDGSINQDCWIGFKFICWDFLEEEGWCDFYEMMSDFILVMQVYDVFYIDDIEYDLVFFIKVIKLWYESMDVVVVVNFGVINQSVFQVFMQMGIWYEYFIGEIFQVIIFNQLLLLEFGEYCLYIIELLEMFIFIQNEWVINGFEFCVVFNFIVGEFFVSYDLLKVVEVQLEVVNLQGQIVYQENLGQCSFGWYGEVFDFKLLVGSYVLCIMVG